MNIEDMRAIVKMMQEERVAHLVYKNQIDTIDLQLMADAYEMPLIETTKERAPATTEMESDPTCRCGKPLGRLLPGLCDKCALAESGVR